MNSETKSFTKGVLLGSAITLVATALLYPIVQPQVRKVIKVVRGAGRKKSQDLEPETNLAGN
jgi:hypothetical protein